MTTKKSNNSHYITTFAFFAMTASMVIAVYGYPRYATSGLSLVFFLLTAAILWFIPVAFVSAEISTIEENKSGGIYTWVGNSLGHKYGFIAIFFQWLHISAGYISMIYFILGTLSYLFGYEALDQNPVIKFIGVVVIFWVLTFTQFRGSEFTAKLAKYGFFLGIVCPALLLFGLGIAYIVAGHPINIEFTWGNFFPDFSSFNTLTAFVAFILAFMGVEASAAMIGKLKNPKKQYPIILFLLVGTAIFLDTFGGLTIATTIPLEELSLSGGVTQTFAYLFGYFGLGWLSKIVAVFLAFGVIAEISSWIIGPSVGMLEVAREGILPSVFAKTNKHDVPVALIIAQAVIVTLWAVVVTLGGGGTNMSFQIAMSLTVLMYMVAYALLFIAYLRIAKRSDIKRMYEVPFGLVGKYLFAIVGLVLTIFAFFISFVPPETLSGFDANIFVIVLIVCFVISVAIPLVIYFSHGRKIIKKKKRVH